MSIHKFLKNWILPPMVYRSIGQMHFELMDGITDQIQYILERNGQFRDKYKGKRGFVIGNGSSLTSLDLSLLQSEVTFAMNRIYLYEPCKNMVPTFYCALDHADELIKPDGDKFLQELNKNIHPVEGYFFHLSAKPYTQRYVPVHRSYYVKTDVAVETLTSVEKDWDIDGQIPGCRSTAQLAIILAMYCGCDPIYLIGMDSDWLSHRGIDKHVYGGDESDHNLGTTPYTELMSASLRQFRGYEVIRKYANNRNVRIINATPGTFLDVFPQVKYSDLFGGNK